MLLFGTGHPATALTKTVAAKPRHGFRDISLCRNFHKIEDSAFGAGTPVARILPPPEKLRPTQYASAAKSVCGRQRRSHREPQFSASFSALPALNAGTFDALILMVWPVRGLRPERAARLRTTKVPKPTSDTSSPFFSARLI